MSIKATDLISALGVAPKPGQITTDPVGKAGWSKPAVGDSEDLERIKKLPRRKQPTQNESEEIAQLMTSRLSLKRNDECNCHKIRPVESGSSCLTKLRHAQAWALLELYTVGGIIGSIGVGHGKTLLGILSPMVLKDCEVALLLCPPGLVDQIVLEYRLAYEHFDVPSLVIHGKSWSRIIDDKPVLHVLPYSRLCRSTATTFIRRLNPDFIISDEVHKLKDRTTATVSRVLRHFEETEMRTRFAGWTGSLTDKSLHDFAHISALALKTGSPLPLQREVLSEWAGAIDPSPFQTPPGKLFELCKPGEDMQQAFYKRLVETPGFIATSRPAIDAALVITQRKSPKIPTVIKEALEMTRGGVRPDGEELVEAFEIARSCRELACGFYYRWTFPNGEKESQIKEWLAARKEYNRELREKLKPRKEFLDSPFLCQQAAMRYHDGLDCEGPEWKSLHWPRWRDVKDTVKPVTEPVRLDPFLAIDASEWAHRNLGIVWYSYQALGGWISEISGLDMHGGGPDSAQRIAKIDGKKTIVVSINAHGTGRDGLQRLYNKQLIANPPSSSSAWEQLLGRLHRIGQSEKAVYAKVYRHTEEFRRSIDTALSRASYVQDVLGNEQKLKVGYDF